MKSDRAITIRIPEHDRQLVLDALMLAGEKWGNPLNPNLKAVEIEDWHRRAARALMLRDKIKRAR